MKTRKLIELGWFVTLLSFTSLFVYTQDQTSSEKNSNTVATITSTSEAVGNMSPEERLIRSVYRKLSIYEAVDRISRARGEGRMIGRALAQNALKFQLRDFRVGSVGEIQSTKYSDLVSSPSGEIIQIGTTDTTNGSEETKFSLNATWRSGQYASGFDPGWTIGDMLQFEVVRFSDVGKFASYEVTVLLEGKTRTYRALALFHNVNRSSEPLIPEFLDRVVGMGGIVTRVFRENKLPLGMRRTTNSAQIVETDQNSEQFSEQKNERKGNKNISPDFFGDGTACTFSLFDFGGGCDCVDWGDGVVLCSIPIFIPFPGTGGGGSEPPCTPTTSSIEPPQVYSSDNNYHINGSHHGRSQFRMTCGITPTCQQTCNALIVTQAYADAGNLDETFYYHQGGSNSTIRNDIGSRDSEVRCEAATGYAFRRCFLDCAVSVQISVSGQGAGVTATASGGDLWNQAHAQGRTCRNGQ